MSGGGGGVIIIGRLLDDCSSRLSDKQKCKLEEILDKGEVPLSRDDSSAVGFIVYDLCRSP